MLLPCSNLARRGSLRLPPPRAIVAPRRDEPDAARPTPREAFFFAGALRGLFGLFFGFIFASLFRSRFSCTYQAPPHSHISQCDDPKLRLPCSKCNVAHLDTARRREFENARLPKVSCFAEIDPMFCLVRYALLVIPLEVFINHAPGRTAVGLS